MSDEWRDRAVQALDLYIAAGEPFTADDIVGLIGPPDSEHKPNGRNNAVGSLFKNAAKSGRIHTVGYTRSTTPTRKGGLIAVWQRT